MIVNGIEVFLCNPLAHKDCRGHKTNGCYLKGGPCRLTISKEFEQKMKVVLDEGAYMPERAHPTDAGLDLRCREKFVLWPGSHHTFDTGVHIEIPPGCFGHIESKSGLNVKDSVVSCGGIIDEGYTGSIAVKLYNFGRHDKIFEVGDKIAQIIIQPYLAPEMVVVDSLDQTDRGDAGFGSTGR